MEKNMIKLVQPQITYLKYRKKLLKDKKTMAFNKINGGIVDFNEKVFISRGNVVFLIDFHEG